MFDFGTIQPSKTFVAEPGENITTSVFFFIDSQYGDRNTHIVLNPGRVPPEWGIDIYPPMHEVTLNISGIITSFNENLYTEPRLLLAEHPEVAEPGYVYINSPSGKGYLQAKPVNITIRVPQSAEYGKVYDLTVDATGSWFGEAGQIQLSQSRNFDYHVLIASKTYSEEIVTVPANTSVANESAVVEKEPENAPQSSDQFFLYLAIGLLIIVIIFLLLKNFRQAPSTVQLLNQQSMAMPELKEVAAKKRKTKKARKKKLRKKKAAKDKESVA